MKCILEILFCPILVSIQKYVLQHIHIITLYSYFSFGQCSGNEDFVLFYGSRDPFSKWNLLFKIKSSFKMNQQESVEIWNTGNKLIKSHFIQKASYCIFNVFVFPLNKGNNLKYSIQCIVPNSRMSQTISYIINKSAQ